MSIRFLFRRLFVAFLFLNVALPSSSQNGLSFDEEYLTFELSRNEFRVNGIYVFSASNSIEHSILYPFPVDSSYGKATSVYVKDVGTGLFVPFTMDADSSGIRFRIKVSGSKQLQIGYRQALKSCRAKYILTSTQKWGSPLKFVDYKLVADADIQITKFPMEPQRTLAQAGKRIFFWQQKEYMPASDFEIQFK